MKKKKESITNKEFIGTVLPDLDQKMIGRYKVHIPELMEKIPKTEGMWFQNQVHKYHLTASDNGEIGQHFPVPIGSKVIVRFTKPDFNSGYIDRILSTDRERTDVLAQDCTESKTTLSDRDNQWILLKTPHNIIYINEETEKEPNTLYIIYNRDNSPQRRSVIRIDESGIHTYTRNNNRLRVGEDDNEQVDKNKTSYIKKTRTAHIDEDDNIETRSNKNTRVNNSYKILSNGQLSNMSNSYVSIDGPMVYINCGMSVPPNILSKTEVIDLGPNDIGGGGVGNPPNPTQSFNDEQRETLIGGQYQDEEY